MSLPTFQRSVLPPSSGRLNSLTALVMDAVKASETSVNSYQTTRRYNPEGGHLHSHRRENLKSYKIWDMGWIVMA
jgi:hypothetical protein